MDKAPVLSLTALAVAALAIVVSLYAAIAPGLPTPGEYDARGAADAAAHEQQLLQHMVLFQRYLEKAAAAGAAENWELATFYAHELEENAKGVRDGGFVDDGIYLESIAAELAVPAAEQLHAAAETADDEAFATALGAVAASCNTCHERTSHPFLVIEVPEGASGGYPSQRFAPTAPLARDG